MTDGQKFLLFGVAFAAFLAGWLTGVSQQTNLAGEVTPQQEIGTVVARASPVSQLVAETLEVDCHPNEVAEALQKAEAWRQSARRGGADYPSLTLEAIYERVRATRCLIWWGRQ